MADDLYALYAIRYASNPKRRRVENFQFPTRIDPHDAPMPMEFYVWVAVGPRRTVLIDTGATEEVCVRRDNDFLRCPTEGLRAVGVDPAKIDDVVVTHLHWDHAGNWDKFPNARIWLQQAEMAYATGPYAEHAFMRRPFEPAHLAGLIAKLYEGRLSYVDGEAELAPNLTLHRVGGHTPGQQVARVKTRRGWIVVASDALHYYANMERDNPFQTMFCVPDAVVAFSTMRRLADSDDHIIPGHDPLVLDKYPPAGDNLKGVAVRLD
jgi:glyoxylase-like metal-dependent hydrolase (beta-lactamase superfamily II)